MEIAAASEAGAKLLANLPAQFLALVLLNTAFVLGMLWFLNNVDARRVAYEQNAMDARERVLASCLEYKTNALRPP